jgi:Cu-Zn family superoxide dismutase
MLSNLQTASVTLLPDFNSSLTGFAGVAVFRQSVETPLEITLKLTGLNPNSEHGWHIHTAPVAAGNLVNCSTTGGHFNPKNATHGAPENDETKRHYGDLGNFITDASGSVDLKVTDKLASLFGNTSISGLGLVIHAKKDDLGLGEVPASLTTGDAGSRLACGNIVSTTLSPNTDTANVSYLKDAPAGTYAASLPESSEAAESTEIPLYSSAAGFNVGSLSFLAFLLM